MTDVSHLAEKLAALSHQRKLHCGLAIAPGQLGTMATAGWDFITVPLLRDGEVAFSDLTLPSSQWSLGVVGELPRQGSADEVARAMAWATHLGLPAVLCPIELADELETLRPILLHLDRGLPPAVFVEAAWTASDWRRWHRIRKLAAWDPRLRLCLQATAAPADLEHFLAEPVECMRIVGPYDEDVVRRLFRNRAERIFFEPSEVERRADLQETFRAAWADVSDHDRFAADQDDALVPPVLPHQDDLTSAVYATFERAAPKYERYQQAIEMAMKDAPVSCVLVAGAGRGPLVTACIAAARANDAEVEIIAVEKNPNAVVTLEEKNRRQWNGRVQVVAQDMRDLQLERAPDLIVSELLGSFGDNELSPECLDGAQRHLADGGRMIPRRSRSWLAPLYAPRLAGVDKPVGITMGRARMLSEPQVCFTFEHPTTTADHRRRQTLSFIASADGPLNGFVGFFDAQLYEGVEISIRPATHTPDMDGWDPLFFPLPRPVDVTAGQSIRVTLFRDTDGRRVWYEWALEGPEVLPVCNVGGADYAMLL